MSKDQSLQTHRQRNIGCWFGGATPPPQRLLDRIEEQESRAVEAYALQSGRERGHFIPAMEQFRARLALIAEGASWQERRSTEAALRRSLRRYPGDPNLALDVLEELGTQSGTDDQLRSWLLQDLEPSNTEALFELGQIWRPAPEGQLQRLLAQPSEAAGWLSTWLSPPTGGPVRVVTHDLDGLGDYLVGQLMGSRVAAYHVGGDIHLLGELVEFLEVWDRGSEPDLEDGTPLSVLETLILHEMTEVAAAEEEGLGPAATHVLALVTERLWGRGGDLANAVNSFFTDRLDELGADLAARGEDSPTDDDEEDQIVVPTTVLVVDGAGMARNVICNVARQLGFPVTEAATGRDALAAATQNRPALIVLDINLPDEDGLQLLAGIRQINALATTPVVVVTAGTDNDRIRQAAVLGVTDFLLKPVNAQELGKRLRKHLG